MPDKKPSRRQERVNSRIVQEVSAIIRELKDERIGFITVTRSEVSPDLRNANVYISVYGDDNVKMETMRALKKATSFVRKNLGKVLQTKVTPEINFKIEKRIESSAEMSSLIDEARATDPGLIENDENDTEQPSSE